MECFVLFVINVSHSILGFRLAPPVVGRKINLTTLASVTTDKLRATYLDRGLLCLVCTYVCDRVVIFLVKYRVNFDIPKAHTAKGVLLF